MQALANHGATLGHWTLLLALLCGLASTVGVNGQGGLEPADEGLLPEDIQAPADFSGTGESDSTLASNETLLEDEDFENTAELGQESANSSTFPVPDDGALAGASPANYSDDDDEARSGLGRGSQPPPLLQQQEPEPKETPFQYGLHYCTCDLTAGSCNPNCCCDQDCTERDMAVFSGCRKVIPYNADLRYCHTTEVVVKHNNVAAQQMLVKKVRQGADYLFCILVDNLPEHSRFLERSPLPHKSNDTSGGADAVLKDEVRLLQLFQWPLSDLNLLFKEDRGAVVGAPKAGFTHHRRYYVGHPIWTYYPTNGVLNSEGAWEAGSGGSLGHLSQPASLNGGPCHSYSPVLYMTEGHNRTCRRRLTPEGPSGILSNCSKYWELSAANYLEGYRVVRSPAHFWNWTSKTLPGNGSATRINPQGSTEDPFVPGMEVVLCRKGQQDEERCGPAPSGPLPRPTKDCKDVLGSLHFQIWHNGAEGIQSIRATVGLVDLSGKTGVADRWSFDQTFGYSHTWWGRRGAGQESKKRDDTTDLLHRRSGNPGYLLGKPILTALLYRDNPQVVQTQGEASSPPGAVTAPGPGGTLSEKGLEVLRRDRLLSPLIPFLTLMPQSPDGACESILDAWQTIQRIRVQFGQNLRLGCTFRVRREELLGPKCHVLKADILDLLVGWDTLPDQLRSLHVGTFGNVKTDRLGDWVNVVVTQPPPAPPAGGAPLHQGRRRGRAATPLETTGPRSTTTTTPSPDSSSTLPNLQGGIKQQPHYCQGLVTDLTIEVVFTRVGSFNSPQNKIVAVNYRFGNRVDLLLGDLGCPGLAGCNDYARPVAIDVATSVTFVDITRPAVPVYAQYPVIDARLPYDFFYPFGMDGGALGGPQSSPPKMYLWLACVTFALWHLESHSILS